MGHVCEECREFVHGGRLDGVVLARPHEEECGWCWGELGGEKGELVVRKVSVRASPVVVYFPQGLCGEGGKGEPIVKFVFLEVGERDE